MCDELGIKVLNRFVTLIAIHYNRVLFFLTIFLFLDDKYLQK